ncbi:MAG: hypothetical protein FD163_1870 [Hyphomonadaceae bacterium]|nr:MAG: hypothetical protein FD128_2168 [Hyphomonadaceae bacterium]KAF0184296.1 MAG: hypothetical protein FD163_1870 [Hyphomonadaceae bacterium]
MNGFRLVVKMLAGLICFAIVGAASEGEERALVKDKGGWFSSVGETSLSESPDTRDEILFFYAETVPYRAWVFRIVKAEQAFVETSTFTEMGGPHYGVITGGPLARLEKTTTRKLLSQPEANELFDMAISTKMTEEEIQSRRYCTSHVVFYFEARRENTISNWGVNPCGSQRFFNFIDRVQMQ